MPDDVDNSAVSPASVCKEVRATVGGVFSVVAVTKSVDILCLVLLPPLHLQHFLQSALVLI